MGAGTGGPKLDPVEVIDNFIQQLEKLKKNPKRILNFDATESLAGLRLEIDLDYTQETIADIEKELQPLNWLEYQKTIYNSINTLKNETRRVTDHHIEKIGHKWPYRDQMTKIFEECIEISNAIISNDPENEREEYIDLIMSVMTLLHINEVTDSEIKQGVVKVLNKFVERGWLKP